MGPRRTLLIDDIHRRVPPGVVATGPVPGRWGLEPMDGGPVLVAPPDCRTPDLVLFPGVEGTWEVRVGLCSLDGWPSEVEARVGQAGPWSRLRLEGGEIDCREASLGALDLTGRRIVLRHPPGRWSCLSHLRLLPR